MKLETENRVHTVLNYVFWAAAILALTLVATNALGAANKTLRVGLVLDGGDLSDTAVSSTIDMCPSGTGACYDKLTLQANVTAGTTTNMQVSCETSNDDTTWFWVNSCASGTCTVAAQDYDVSSVTKHEVPLTVTQRYIRCTFDDSADGTGTVDVSATLQKEES